ncbi:MAG: amylo-alpha-1,6-glucosidase [Alphaproteobacteria bacterium]|nr:amylo-alpha-1,6-glucosidase [Alphaproteobacteria bacterium]
MMGLAKLRETTDGEVAPHFLPVLLSPLYQLHVLKHKDAFGVFNMSGNVMEDPETSTGLFVNDTRHLSHWWLSIANARLKLLSTELDDDGVLLDSNMTNMPFRDQRGEEISEALIYVRRQKIIRDEILLEKVTLLNYGELPASIHMTLQYAADFLDIFEVRGMDRGQRGRVLESGINDGTAVLRYKGVDGALRETHIGFSEAPSRLGRSDCDYEFRLEPNETWSCMFSVGARRNDFAQGDFDGHLSACRERIRRRCADWIRVESSNQLFNSWLDSSKKALALLVTDTDEGLYPYAGIPWFSTAFGRDGLVTAFQTLFFQPGIARGVLTYLAAHQATEYDSYAESAPGKILHETRNGEMALAREVPFRKYYGSVDSTPLFVMLGAAYFRQTRDLDFMRTMWPPFKAALHWIETDGDRDGDGFVEYKRSEESGLFTQGWKDSWNSVFHEDGRIAEPPIALCEVQGYVYAALKGMAEIAWVMNEDDLSARLERKAQALFETFNNVFWMEDKGTYALALDKDKRPCRVKSSNVGHLLFSGIVPEERAGRIVAHLMSEEMFSGWGIRTIGTGESLYNPIAYHNGSVWPHDTGICAAGFARYGYFREAETLLAALFEAATRSPHRMLPELFCGFPKEEGSGLVFFPTACLPQAWSSGAVFMALEAALGLERTDAGGFAARSHHSGLFRDLELVNGSHSASFRITPWVEDPA